MTDQENAFGSGEFGGQFNAGANSDIASIIDHVLTATGINTTDTDYRSRVLTFCNFVYLKIIKGRHWKFAQKELYIDLKAPYEAGTVTLTEGGYEVPEDVDTANGAVPILSFNSTHEGMLLVPQSGEEATYRVDKVTNSKLLTLQSLFAGDTQTFAAYKILFDRLSLDAKIQVITSLSIGSRGEIKPVGKQEFFNRKQSNPGRVGSPEIFTLVNSEDDSGQWTIEFYPAPDKRYSTLIEYIERPTGLEDSDTCFTMIPPEHMDVLYYGVLAEVYRYQENPAMATLVGNQAAELWRRFASDQNMTDSVARIQHGRRYFNRYRYRYPGYYGLRWFGRVED